MQSNTLQATAEGQIVHLTTTADTNASGTVNYDLAQVTPLLRPYVGDGDSARRPRDGAVPSRRQLRESGGPFGRARCRRGSMRPWTSANVYGLPIGAGRIAGALGEGQVRFDPLALAVAEGRLTADAAGAARSGADGTDAAAGPVITDVRISPEVSEGMLKYVAPVLSGATQSEGQFSLELDGARVPLADTKQGGRRRAADGSFRSRGPRSNGRDWVALARQIEAIAKRRDPTSPRPRHPVTLLTVQDQQVKFHVVDGRVYHQGMQFQIGDVTMQSEGSVGFDETLQLVLQIPIQDRWIEGQQLLVGLKGQSLAVPVTGTLNRPQMDQRAIAGLSQQLLQKAAGQAIGGELNKAFDKLFKPRRDINRQPRERQECELPL